MKKKVKYPLEHELEIFVREARRWLFRKNKTMIDFMELVAWLLFGVAIFWRMFS